MTKRSYLGELEIMLLLAIVALGEEEAYGVPICREIERHRAKTVALGSVYAALERLESSGLIVSRLGDATPERGGKARRYFRITKRGLQQLNEMRRILTTMWQAIPEPTANS